ncbi:putative Acid phosphatase [Rosa chinensis]|uniref:Putative Acid phosphatase n=1 Tax=Rosa chinensis TaxID=74649 RepID=A0A2P6R3J8_ROSCH|nr:putative Acid phosphatase [Rosa chinensis]
MSEDAHFVISTGDNFYEDGVTGNDDPAFNESFFNIYTAPRLQTVYYLAIYSANSINLMASLYSSNSNRTMQRFSFPQFLILTACLSLCLVAKADLQPFQQQANADGSLSFLVVGDWGRRGLYNQSKVATQMGIIGEKAQTNFVISTGDNFYDDGLTGPDDPAFNESFSNIYTAPSLHIPWYIAIAEFFFVDTTPFVDDYFTNPKEHVYDWRGVLPREDYLPKLLKANKIDFYINGHDHCLQHISDPDR